MQRTLFNPASNAARPDVDQVLDVAAIRGRDLDVSLRVTGRHVHGQVTLLKSNPRGDAACAVNYTAPQSWRVPEFHAAALRVVLHWFRDIGGFRAIERRHVAHVYQRLCECKQTEGRRRGEQLYPETVLHAAIDIYAASEWHRRNRKHTDITRFFTNTVEFLDKWVEQGQARVDRLARERRERQASQVRAVGAESERVQARRAAGLPLYVWLIDWKAPGALPRRPIRGEHLGVDKLEADTADQARQAFAARRPGRLIVRIRRAST